MSKTADSSEKSSKISGRGKNVDSHAKSPNWNALKEDYMMDSKKVSMRLLYHRKSHKQHDANLSDILFVLQNWDEESSDEDGSDLGDQDIDDKAMDDEQNEPAPKKKRRKVSRRQ